MEENIGMVMGFTIISAALEWLGNKWEEIQQEEKELAEKIKQEEEEAEKVIKVPGGFKIWSTVTTKNRFWLCMYNGLFIFLYLIISEEIGRYKSNC